MAGSITQWLHDLGLEAYIEAFEENDLELELVADLTNADLKDLGVVSMGHRKKLLRAIEALNISSNPPNKQMKAAPDTADLQPNNTIRTSQAERRQLSILFCDMVGSTALSQQLDPEDLREITRQYQDSVSGAIARYEGHVAKFLGDGVLAYFGWPHAYEDQAERAVRAGLDAVSAVQKVKLDGKSNLEARVGIATGLVVVGDLVGESGLDAEAVSGETPNLAARLQQFASPGQVIIGTLTKKLVSGLFSLEQSGAHELKGFEESISTWIVKGEIKAESRFAAAHDQLLTSFIGRQSEFNILLDRWELAKAGEGQVVLLSGEAGIGKSRITETLRDQIKDDEYLRLQYQCSPHHVNSPLYPAIRQLEFAAGFKPEDTAEDRLDKLERLLKQSSTISVAPLIAALLSTPSADRYSPLDLTPQEQKHQTIQALVQIFEGLIARQPVLFIFEDAHWIDPTTREQMDFIIDRVASLSALVIITHRPEFETAWASHAYCTVLALNRLGRKACADLINLQTGGLPLPNEVFEQIVSKTDGVPLFLEELTKTVLESELLVRQSDRYVLSGPLPPFAIPSTLKDSLMARLDRLEASKEIAQIGATIGREFSSTLLRAILPINDLEFEKAINILVEAEIVFQRGVEPNASYVFKHALIQDTAYDSLLISRRQQIHARLAEVLQKQFPERAEKEPELLAHHYTQAGLLQEAAPYWLLAGQRAVTRSANLEAIAQLNSGLDVVAKLPSGSGASNLELDMQISLGSALIASRGYSAVETEEAWLRARRLLGEVGEDSRQFAVLHGLSMIYWNRAQLKQMQEVSEDMLQRARRQNEVLPKLVANRVRAVGFNTMGKFGLARKHSKFAADLYDPVTHKNTAHQFGHDQGVGAYWHQAIALLFLGYPDASAEAGSKAMALNAELQNANTNSYNSLWVAFTKLIRRDWKSAREAAELMIEDANARSMALWVAYGHHVLGSTLVNLGEMETGLKQLHLGRQKAKALNNKAFKPMTLRFEAQALSSLGQHDEALICANEALQIGDKTGECWWLSDIHRMKGEIILNSNGSPKDGEACFKQATAVATEQKSRLFELRSGVALGKLWRDQGRGDEAYEMLAPIYNWFTEGFELPDLKDAKILLDKLI